MSSNERLARNLNVPINPDPNSVSQPSDKPSSWKAFKQTTCFKYTKYTLIVIYALNIVAWGGMLFLILVGAANNTMPDEQTRKIWIEIDSQILNALFCVTGIGLIPWRVRDLYQIYREKHRHKVLHRYYYTDNLRWIQIIIWTNIANSLFQIGMAVCMWSMDMYKRPSWLVGLFVGLGCASGMFAGLARFFLERQTKKRTQTEQDRATIIDGNGSEV